MKFRLYYTGIRVRDLDESIRFYTKILGMEVAHSGTMPHGGKFVQLRSPGEKKMLELNWYPKKSRFYSEYTQGEEMDHIAFVVPDVKEAYEYLVKKKVKVAVPPEESKGTEIYVKDPDGIWIELLQSS